MDDKKLLSQIEAAAIACRNATDKDFLETRRLVDEFRALTTPENVMRLVGMVRGGCDLRWTNEPPTVPGFYWWRAKNIPPTVASVITKGEIDYWHREDCEWAGPLPQPQDAE